MKELLQPVYDTWHHNVPSAYNVIFPLVPEASTRISTRSLPATILPMPPSTAPIMPNFLLIRDPSPSRVNCTLTETDHSPFPGFGFSMTYIAPLADYSPAFPQIITRRATSASRCIMLPGAGLSAIWQNNPLSRIRDANFRTGERATLLHAAVDKGSWKVTRIGHRLVEYNPEVDA